MSGYSDSYEFDESDFYEDFDAGDEAVKFGFRPAKKISVPGAGLLSATLQTPKGPARLSLPSAVPTHTQFRQLEAALNAQSQRMNAVQAELVKVRRELTIRRRDQSGLGSTSMLFPLLMQKKLRDDLEGHTHATAGSTPTLPTSTSGGLSSMLPLLLLSPGLFGGATPGSPTGAAGMQDGLSPLLLMMMFSEL